MMKRTKDTVFVAGADGVTGTLIVRTLAERGYQVTGLASEPEKKEELQQTGAEVREGSLESAFSDGLTGADAVICAEAPGMSEHPGHSDNLGTIRLIEQCRLEGIGRFILVSALGTQHPESAEQPLKSELLAKRRGEAALAESGMSYTIIRPGELTDEPGTGLVEAAPLLQGTGNIPREDVASAVLAALENPELSGCSFEIVSGNQPLDEALRAIGRKDGAE